ncbi:hypothetical protein D3C84_1134560 [compost metagenome]
MFQPIGSNSVKKPAVSPTVLYLTVLNQWLSDHESARQHHILVFDAISSALVIFSGRVSLFFAVLFICGQSFDNSER